MTSLCSQIHILTLGLELRANDFFFLMDGADMSEDMAMAAKRNIPPYFSITRSDGGRMYARMDRG